MRLRRERYCRLLLCPIAARTCHAWLVRLTRARGKSSQREGNALFDDFWYFSSRKSTIKEKVSLCFIAGENFDLNIKFAAKKTSRGNVPRTVFIINKPCLNILLSESSTNRIRAGGCIARSDTYFFCRAVAFAVMVITVCHIAGNSLVFLAGLAGAGIFSCIIHNNFYPFLSGKNILRSYFYIILYAPYFLNIMKGE